MKGEAEQRPGWPVSQSRFETPALKGPLEMARSRSPSSLSLGPESAVEMLKRSGARSMRRSSGRMSVRYGDANGEELAVPEDRSASSRSNSLSVPGAEEWCQQATLPSLGGPYREVNLGCMLTVHKKPSKNILDALALPLFRMQEST